MMKRFLAALFVGILLITAAAAGYAGSLSSEVWLPSQIQNYLSKEKLSGYTVTSYAEGLGKSSNFAFVLLQGSKGKNVLYAFKENSKGWSYQYKTSAGIPQGATHTAILATAGNTFFVIAQDGWHKYAQYEQRGGNWQLSVYYDESRKMKVEVTESRLTYYGGDDLDKLVGRVNGTVQTDLRYVGLSTIPSTLKEAKNKYTLAPALPAGTLSAQVIKFTGGKLYPVYSGPGETYVRSANGKAAVSTNDWIQVFGREGDWIMIQYAIDAARYRIGYISAASLPSSAEVPYLYFLQAESWTVGAAELTDDPLFSRSVLMYLPANTRVIWLATMGEWAYVELPQYTGARGFLPLTEITGDWELDEDGLPIEGEGNG